MNTDERRPKVLVWIFTAIGGLLAISIFLSAFISLPYYVLSPGGATGVAQYVDIPADKRMSRGGDVQLTTVGLLHAHPLDIAIAWLTPGAEIQPIDEVIGKSTPSQYLKLNDDAMADSKMTAIENAMRKAGYTATPRGSGATVLEVDPKAPAQGILKPGETVVGVDGKTVGVSADLASLVRSVPAGERVELDVIGTDNAKRKVEIPVAARPRGLQGSYVGVVVQTKDARIDTPFNVGLSTTKIGGPSAGLAFTLSLLDALTPGKLTGEKNVAVTGTIEDDGSVGPVGGVAQKAQAVKKAGTKLFLVPPDEFDEARRNAGSGVKVVKVSTLDEALAALRASGGDPLVPVSSVRAGQ